jgi:hypothetical protein
MSLVNALVEEIKQLKIALDTYKGETLYNQHIRNLWSDQLSQAVNLKEALKDTNLEVEDIRFLYNLLCLWKEE